MPGKRKRTQQDEDAKTMQEARSFLKRGPNYPTTIFANELDSSLKEIVSLIESEVTSTDSEIKKIIGKISKKHTRRTDLTVAEINQLIEKMEAIALQPLVTPQNDYASLLNKAVLMSAVYMVASSELFNMVEIGPLSTSAALKIAHMLFTSSTQSQETLDAQARTELINNKPSLINQLKQLIKEHHPDDQSDTIRPNQR
tara:strand:- start:991 stop:1587 length:597 start_codon:yes stop_codon:yes gene_type:complete